MQEGEGAEAQSTLDCRCGIQNTAVPIENVGNKLCTRYSVRESTQAH